MTRRSKLLHKAENHPGGLSFGEFETLLGQSGWVFDRQAGSHRIWVSPGGVRLSAQPRKDGKAKAYQVRQFLRELGHGPV